ncbi:MAG: glycosyltransferase family 2 protein [Deltaproteobacteria bacterium]|nr:glycosyltransferase family 2 protein [Deltaproteobacteria bacterium]
MIVPTHDARELTLACLRALDASLGLGSLEIVVVDDGSRDGSFDAIAAAHPHVKLVRLDPGCGFTVAVNTGVASATGRDLALLNSDTEVAPDALARLVAALDRDAALGVAGAALVYPNGEDQWSAGSEPSLAWLFVLSSGLATLAHRLAAYRRWRRRDGAGPEVQPVGWVPGAAIVVRRSAWEAVGPLDTRFALYAQDLDLCVRVRRAGWSVALVRGARVVHHLGATIGALPESSADRAQRALLWTDLVRWAHRARGPRFGHAARHALLAGAWLRVALTALGALPRDRRDRAAHGAAIAALTGFDVTRDAPNR